MLERNYGISRSKKWFEYGKAGIMSNYPVVLKRKTTDERYGYVIYPVTSVKEVTGCIEILKIIPYLQLKILREKDRGGVFHT